MVHAFARRRNQLPDINAAVVLAAAALETFISETCQSLAARSSLPLDQRKKLLAENSSPANKFDVLLKAFTGYSLKNDKELWDGYRDLRQARNKIAHKASIDGTGVTSAKANDLISIGRAVINRIEEQIPSDLRAPRFESGFRADLSMRQKIDPEMVRSEFLVQPVVLERKK